MEEDGAASAEPGPPAAQPHPPASAPDSATVTLTIYHHAQPHTCTLPAAATVADLINQLAAALALEPAHLKLLALPAPGLLKPPFRDPPPAISTLLRARKITLIAPTAAELASLARPAARPPPPVQPARPRRTAPNPYTIASNVTTQDEQYSFATLVPLQRYPDPSRARDYLARLANDAGVRAAMRRHRFAVPVLAEMDPLDNISRESRTLGLNRNRGEAIELVLRTDAYDGFRDYRGVRRVLCHELAHCVHGEHDAQFWKLCREIEGEVERGDWRRGGRTVGDEEYWAPPEGADAVVDGGGWTGGEFRLGGGGGGQAAGGREGLSRRELMAAAAEARSKQSRAGKEAAEPRDAA